MSDKIHTIKTDKFMYVRGPNGSWEQEELPVVVLEIDKFPPLESVAPIPKKKKK